ncbi:MAG: hypothetical protein WBB34_07930, partial [Xanthobacteraceae bacterium]
TLDLNGAATIDNGALTNLAGGNIDATTGSNEIAATTLTNAGTMEVTGGTLTIHGTVNNSGTLEADGATLVIASDADITGTNQTVTITGGGTAEFAGGSSGSPFDLDATLPGSGMLQLDQSQYYGGTIGGFATGDTIDLKDIAYAAGTETDVWNNSNDTLTVTIGSSTAVLHFSGSYNQSSFALTNDGSGDTDVIASTATGSVTGVDSSGNAVESSAVAANLTDMNATGIVYHWLDDGATISGATSASYMPVSGDIGQTLDVVIGFTDNGTVEQITELAGTVATPLTVSIGTTSPATTTENMALTLTTLSATFADAHSDTITVTLDTDDGTLALVNGSGLGSDTGTGAIGSPLTLSGTAAEIDAALANGVTYTPNGGFGGTDTLSFSASDGAIASNTATLDINVAAAAPTLTIADHDLSVGQGNSVPLGISETPYTSGDAVLVTISGIPTDASLTDTNNDTLTVNNGTITLTPSELDGLSLQAGVTSGTLTVTAQEITGGVGSPTTVNFDSIDTSGGPVGGATLATYLAGYGITMSVSGPGAAVTVDNQDQVYSPGGVVGATSGDNLIIESGGHPVSYTLTFATPLSSFAFDQAIEYAGSSFSAWSATAYDAAGDVLSTVGDSSISYGSPAMHYMLTGSDITSVTFTGNDYGSAGTANEVTDTWVLTPEITETSAAQTIDLTVNAPGAAEPFTWLTASSGNWTDGSNWSSGTEPGSTDQAAIDVAGAYTVTVDATDTVAALNVGNTAATLSIAAGVALTVAGTTNTSGTSNVIAGDVTNSGTLTIENGTLELNNDVTNGSVGHAGSLVAGGNGSGAILDIDANVDNSHGTITVETSATLNLSGATISGGIVNNYTSGSTDGIVVSGTNAALDNVTLNNTGLISVSSGAILTFEGTDTISGAGTVSGAIDVGGTVTFEAGTTISAGGVTVESTHSLTFGSGTSTLIDTQITDKGSIAVSGGTLTIGTGSGSSITSGSNSVSTIDNTGTFAVAGSASVTLSGVAIGGDITVGSSAVLTVGTTASGASGATFDGSSINNTGTISVASGALLTLEGTDTINGAGTVTGAIDVGGTVTFEAGGTISAGNVTVESTHSLTFGTGTDTLIDTQITDNGSITVSGNLTFGSSGSGVTISSANSLGTVVNNGTMDVQGTVTISDLSLNNASGQVTVESNESLTLEDGTAVIGGTLTVNTSATLYIENGSGSHGATLDGVNVQNSGTIQVDGSIMPTTVDLVLTDGTTIGGDGTLSIDGFGEVEIQRSDSNWVSPEIYGATFDGGLTINGAVTVDTGATLTLNNVTMESGTIANKGVIDVTSPAIGTGLTLAGGTIDGGTIVNTGGISVSTSGEIDDHASVNGPITVQSNATLTLDDVTYSGTLSNATGSVVQVEASHTLWLNDAAMVSGTVTNNGTIDFTKTTSTISSDVQGSGNVVIENSATAKFTGNFNEDVAFAAAGTLEIAQPYAGTVSNFKAGDTIDLTGITYSSGETDLWTQSGGSGTLQIFNSADVLEETLNLSGAYTQSDFMLMTDGSTANAGQSGTDVVVSPRYWGTAQYPAVSEGEHLFGVNPQVNSTSGFLALVYNEAFDYSSGETSYSVTPNVAKLDPFFLPDAITAETASSFTVDAPARYSLIVPNISVSGTTETEGIYVYKAQANTDGTGGNALWQVIITGDSNDGLTFGTPTEIGTAATTGEAIFNVGDSFKTNSSSPATATSYDIAWDQYNGTTGQYSVEVQVAAINSDGSFAAPADFSPVITPGGATSVTVSADTDLPAWQFHAAGGGGNTTPTSYALAVAETNSTTGLDMVHVQGYAVAESSDVTSVTPNTVSFSIAPNLTHYASGAINQIVQPIIADISAYPGQGASALNFTQLSSNNNGDYAVVWNETVTDAAGTVVLGDQVEFALFRTGTGMGTGTVYQAEVQIADGNAQNVRVVEFADPLTGQDDVVAAYGDATGTHVVEYGVTSSGTTTTVTLLDTFTDPTTQTFDTLTALGDGRIALGYNELVNGSPDETSQFSYNIYDLRSQGLDETLSTTQNNYIAGTQFNDMVTGGNGVNNEYYYVGNNTLGMGPVDTFNGGTGGGWNTAIFADDANNYTIVANVGGGYTITNTGDPAHAGQLTVDSNVQALAFNPAQDPNPTSAGAIEATGDTLVVLEQSFAAAATIAAGATLEFFSTVAAAASVTFSAGTGSLVLNDPSGFAGQITGFTGTAPDAAHSDVVDLVGINYNSSSFSETYNSTTGVLTVTDGTHTASITFDDFNGTLDFASDGNGGTDVFDPPSTGSASEPPTLSSAATTDSDSGSRSANLSPTDWHSGDIFTDRTTTDGSDHHDSLALGRPDDSNGHAPLDHVRAGFDFTTHDTHADLAASGADTQSDNTTGAHTHDPAQTETQPASVSIGGPGNDHFVFHADLGADNGTSGNPQHDTVEHENTAQVQTAQELQALISHEAHGDAAINLSHHDAIAFAEITETHLQHVIQAGHLLLH